MKYQDFKFCVFGSVLAILVPNFARFHSMFNLHFSISLDYRNLPIEELFIEFLNQLPTEFSHAAFILE